MTRGETAKNYFLQGYNCAQSVALAFSDVIDMDKETLLKAVSPFGGGMGRLREVCGAVSGMFFVLGCLCGYSDPKDVAAKTELYRHVQNLATEFEKANRSIVCRELLGVSGKQSPEPEKRTEDYYKKRPCPELIRIAADIAEDYISKIPKLL